MIINFNGGGGGSYTLPKASATVLGGIKVGENLSIDANGVLSSEAGGIPVVTSLPSAATVDDMVVFEGSIYQYVTGGTNAYWTNDINNVNNGQPSTFIYSDLSKLDGQEILMLKYSYADYPRKRFFIDVENEQIKVVNYTDSATSSTTIETVTKEGAEVKITTQYSFYYIYCKWEGNAISICNRTDALTTYISGQTLSTSFWKMLRDDSKLDVQKAGIEKVTGIPTWDEYGRILRRNWEVQTKSVKINTTGYSRPTFLFSDTNSMPDSMYVPTAGGTSGYICKSNGGDAAPTFVDFYSTYTNGVHFAKLTESEYEALETKDANTLYLVTPDE